MPERPINPPLDKMIQEIITPDHTAAFFTELVSRQSARYQALHPIRRGTKYETTLGADQRTIDAYPSLFFLKEVNPLGFSDVRSAPSDNYVLWYWSTVRDAESTYSVEISYLGDAIANPVYARSYLVRRATFEAAPTIALGSPLTALIGIKVTAAGSGYSTATVGITGGSGTGATAQAVIDAAGGISEIIVTNEGAGYVTAPAIAITGDGSGATATGTIQIQTAILTSQKKIELDENDLHSHEFCRVLRTYEVLPGPLLPYTRFDENLGNIGGTRQAVVWASQTTSLTATSKITYEARDGSSYVAWKVTESWSDGTGGAGNPAYPTQTSTEFERDGVKKVVTKQLMAAGSVVTDEDLTGGTFTRKFKEAYPDNAALAFQIIETITVDDADFLDDPTFATSIRNLIPEIFLGQVPLHVESHIIEGVAVETVLALGEFEHSEKQLTPLYKEVRSTVLDDIGSLPITISGIKETNQNKQVVSVEMKLCVDSTTPTVPTALIDVDFKKLGNGLAIEITKTIPSVFDGDTRSIEIPDVMPGWAKALLPTTNTSSEAAATSVSDPTLSTGQLRKKVSRTTEKTVQTDITARDAASLPKTRTNKRLTTEFGGGEVDEVQTIATGSQSISSGGLLVLDSEMEVQGDGTSALKTSTQTDGSWPVLYDYDIDEETGQTILTSYQVIAAGSAGTATIASGVVTRYKHIDKWRSMKIITTYSTPASYDEQRFGAHNFPTLWDGVYDWTPECGAFATGFRGGFSAMVRMRTTVSFSTSKASDIDGLTLIPRTFLLGKGVQLPSDLITDSGSFIYSGTCSGTVPFDASDPDYSTYTGSIQGSEQLITGESVKMQKSGLYRTTEVYVYML